MDQLTQENFFQEYPLDIPAFTVYEKINNNHFVFKIPRTKVTPSILYDFEYLPQEQKMKINGKYAHKFFPCLLFYAFPLMGLYFYLTSEQQPVEELKTLCWMFVGVSIYNGVIIFTELDGGEYIDRELIIRFNYLYRRNY